MQTPRTVRASSSASFRVILITFLTSYLGLTAVAQEPPKSSSRDQTVPSISTLTPPIAPRHEHTELWHGRKFTDPYYWLRNKGTPEVVKYLEAENAYTETMSADLKSFSAALYEEMLGRIQETD